MTQGSALCDLVGPPRGPCAFCGDEDARHRIVDAVIERVCAGESVKKVARDYDLSQENVVQLLALAEGVTS